MGVLKLSIQDLEEIEALVREAIALWTLRKQNRTAKDVLIEALKMYVDYLKKKNYYG